jgi:hypothetical protein
VSTQFTQIDIDIDIHRLIEGARLSFTEQPNDILRRLLQIEEHEDSNVGVGYGDDGAGWSGKGITLRHGTELQMTYQGVTHTAVIDNGRWRIGDDLFKSPSDAASGVSKLVTGERKSLNGWIYWIAKDPSGSGLYKKISDIRHLAERNAQDRGSRPKPH